MDLGFCLAEQHNLKTWTFSKHSGPSSKQHMFPFFCFLYSSFCSFFLLPYSARPAIPCFHSRGLQPKVGTFWAVAIYIYIYRERERDIITILYLIRLLYFYTLFTYIYIYIYMYTYIYIYIYLYSLSIYGTSSGRSQSASGLGKAMLHLEAMWLTRFHFSWYFAAGGQCYTRTQCC